MSRTWLSLSDVRWESVFAMAATWVSPPLMVAAAVLSWVSASRPTALRTGSAAPSLSRSSRSAAPANSVQVYVFSGHPSDFAADGTIATPTGEEATLPAAVTRVALLSPLSRVTHRAESGTHAWTSDLLPDLSASATLYDSRAVTVTAMQ